MKKLILFILVFAVLPIVAGRLCEDTLTPGRTCTMFTPSINCTIYNYSIFNETGFVTNGSLTFIGMDIYSAQMNLSTGSYLWRLCDRSTREIYVRGEDNMGTFSITFFIMTITAALFILPFYVKRFHTEDWIDTLIRRAILCVAIYLMVMNSAIMATIADFTGINLTNEMLRFMWLFGQAGYVALIILVITTLFDVLTLKRQSKINKRTL